VSGQVEIGPLPQAAIPKLVTEAGRDAVEAYRAFFTGTQLKPTTLSIYGSAVSRFLRWAEQHGLLLAALARADAEAYLRDLGTRKTSTLDVHLAAIRTFFRHLIDCGVLSDNPFASLRAPYETPPQPDPQLTSLKRTVLEIGEADGWTEESEDFKAGLVMLAPLEIGTIEPEAISQFTGVPLPLVEQFAERLRVGGIWRSDGTIAAEWDDPENGGLAFMLDVWVATGHLERVPAPEDKAAETAD